MSRPRSRPVGPFRAFAWALACLAAGMSGPALGRAEGDASRARGSAANARLVTRLETPEGGIEVRVPGRNSREVELRREDAFEAGTDERAALAFEARLSRRWRSPVRLSFYVQNRQGWYYQTARLTAVPFDRWREFEVDFSPGSAAWEAVGHGRPWDELSARGIFRFGVRLFAEMPYEGVLRIRNVAWRRGSAPWFRKALEAVDLREPACPVWAGELWELAFRASRPVHRPFDPGCADFYCDVIAPDGSLRRVNAFYYQEYMPDDGGGLSPVGGSEWRVRFRPRVAGRYKYRLFLREVDEGGAPAKSDPYKLVLGEGRSRRDPAAAEGWFTVSPPAATSSGAGGGRAPGTSAAKDAPGAGGTKGTGGPRDGDEFVLRLDRRLPGAWRPELTSTPALYGDDESGGPPGFRRRREPAPRRVWRAMLEWTSRWRQWEGLGSYDLALAWRFDRALEEAARRGEALPCSLVDDEPFLQHGTYRWPVNPLSRQEGGPAAGPGEFFTSRKAARHFLARLRYVIARYGHSPAVESWCLASGLPASGVAEWHGRVGGVIGRLDSRCGEGRKIVSLHPFAVPFVRTRDLGEFEKDRPSGWRLERSDFLETGSGARVASLPVRRPGSTDPLDVRVTHAPGQGEGGGDALEAHFASEGWITIARPLDESFFAYDYLTFDVKMPEGASGVGRAQVIFLDRDLFWYEQLLDVPLRAGDWTRCVLDLNTEADRVKAVGHARPWNAYTRSRIRRVALRVFPNGESPGGALIDHVKLHAVGGRAPKPLDVAVETAGPEDVGRFEKYEIVFKPNREFSNPFDPDVVAIDGVFTHESGEKKVVPAFFYEPYTRRLEKRKLQEAGVQRTREVEVLEVAGAPDWRLRFAPTREGRYRVTIRVTLGTPRETVERPGPEFRCVPSKRRGFIRIARDNRYFEYSTGDVFYPIGPVVRSTTDSRDIARDPTIRDKVLAAGPRGTYQFDEYLEALSGSGCNWIRMWLCSWWCGLEWYRKWPGYGGTGWYNQPNAWRIDQVLETASVFDVYVQLCLQNHGQTSKQIDHEWEYNPYNRYEPEAFLNRDEKDKPVSLLPPARVDPKKKRPGGWLEDAADFFSDPRARKAKCNLYRYIIARWGYSTSVFAWVLSSEIEFTGEYFLRQYHVDHHQFAAGQWAADGPDQTPRTVAWHRAMGRYIKKTDPWKHVVTTHFSHPIRGRGVWRLPEMEYAQSNAYTAFARWKWFSGPVDPRQCVSVPYAMEQYYNNFMGNYDKPVLIGEWGGHWMRNTVEFLDAELHTGTWSSVMTPMAGACGFWWWSHVHFRDQYDVYTAVKRFLEGEDRRGLGLRQLPAKIKGDSKGLHALALGNATQADAYVFHVAHTRKLGSAPEVSGATLILPGLERGIYVVEVWDTAKGEPTVRQNAFSDGSELKYDLPPVKGDVALKMRREGSGADAERRR